MSVTIKAPFDLRALLEKMRSAKQADGLMYVWDINIKTVEDVVATLDALREQASIKQMIENPEFGQTNEKTTSGYEFLAGLLVQRDAEIERLRTALTEIAARHIGDQPAALNVPEEQWVRRCYSELRRIAREAVAGVICHASDCALHNAPAYPAGPCDCGALVAHSK